MNLIQSAMESNKHLEDPESVIELCSNVSKFWSVLSEEDKDYIHGARHAIETRSKWK